jgi:hypothetical protein
LGRKREQLDKRLSALAALRNYFLFYF